MPATGVGGRGEFRVLQTNVRAVERSVSECRILITCLRACSVVVALYLSSAKKSPSLGNSTQHINIPLNHQRPGMATSCLFMNGMP